VNSVLLVLAVAALALAALPVLLALRNLADFRPPPSLPSRGGALGVSILIPARNEEAVIEAAVEAARASRDVELEVIVLDDHSTDRTAEIVRGIGRGDPRVRVEPAPPLPARWSGKQHACHMLARLARHPNLLFVDADVRLAPDAAARLAAFLEASGAGLVSGFPRQETKTLGEKLVIPFIHVLLLGYLPVFLMRRQGAPGLGAGCGQLFLAWRDAYEHAGGHAAIRASLHDGITLPRAFRRAGMKTDICDATDLAACRMYRGFGETWRGFGKNATEGMARPAALPVWTLLLGGGHVLPFLLLAAAPAGSPAFLTAALAAAGIWGMRFALARRFRQSLLGAALHPIGMLLVLLIQWQALFRSLTGRKTSWRGRAYP
jgi:hypothetical protein